MRIYLCFCPAFVEDNTKMASTNVNKYISSRLYFGERNFEVKPVGAWVQPNPDEVDVVESATVTIIFMV